MFLYSTLPILSRNNPRFPPLTIFFFSKFNLFPIIKLGKPLFDAFGRIELKKFEANLGFIQDWKAVNIKMTNTMTNRIPNPNLYTRDRDCLLTIFIDSEPENFNHSRYYLVQRSLFHSQAVQTANSPSTPVWHSHPRLL